MASVKFSTVLKSAKLHANDRTWFARWLDAYRKSCGVKPNEAIPVGRDSLIAFLRQQRSKGRKAWQRLQIVKPVELYRNSVPRTAELDLGEIRDTLTIVAQRERRKDSPPLADINVVGKIVHRVAQGGDRGEVFFRSP